LAGVSVAGHCREWCARVRVSQKDCRDSLPCLSEHTCECLGSVRSDSRESAMALATVTRTARVSGDDREFEYPDTVRAGVGYSDFSGCELQRAHVSAHCTATCYSMATSSPLHRPARRAAVSACGTIRTGALNSLGLGPVPLFTPGALGCLTFVAAECQIGALRRVQVVFARTRRMASRLAPEFSREHRVEEVPTVEDCTIANRRVQG
jgi:hypothetical protein